MLIRFDMGAVGSFEPKGLADLGGSFTVATQQAGNTLADVQL